MTAALAAAARQRSDQTRQRATEALQRLHATGQPITFAHVARTAGVSRSWLYRQPDLRAEINRLRRVATGHAVPVPPPERGSTESLRQRLEAALDQQLAEAAGRTRDLGGALATDAFADALAERIATD